MEKPNPTDDEQKIKYSELCAACVDIFRGSYCLVGPHEPVVARLNQTFRELCAAAGQGCHLCRLRLDSLSRKERQSLHDCQIIRYGMDIEYAYLFMCTGHIRFVYDCTYHSDTKPHAGLSKYIYFEIKERLDTLSNLAPDLGRFANSYRPCQSTANETTLELARRWIDNCEKSHGKCRELISGVTRSLPARLLQIDASGDRLQVRLCETAGLPRETRYMTLSHCWGGETPLNLLRGNFGALCREVNFWQVAPTFRDAFEVTSRYGIQYLWIDSLCIIQDSKEDWLKEAAMMGDVYSNSWCNIAATKTSSGSEGCFSTRDADDLSQCWIKTAWEGTHSFDICCYNPHMSSQQIDGEKLARRGWAVQELFLAPRVLHFAEKQLFWRCASLYACEMFPTGFLSHYTSALLAMVNFPRPCSEQERRLPISEDRLRSFLWGEYLGVYTRGGLTRPQSDRLIAISGLARRLGFENDYCAGLWRSNLMTELLWMSAGGRGTTRLQQAPTWSWASIYGPVKIYTASEASALFFVEILECKVSLVGPDAFGPVRGGKLVIEGLLVKAEILCAASRGDRLIQMKTAKRFCDVLEDAKAIVDGTELFLVPIGTWRNSKTGDETRILLLQPTGRRRGEFFRRGVLNQEEPKEFGVKYSELTRNIFEMTAEPLEAVYLEDHASPIKDDPDRKIHRLRISIV